MASSTLITDYLAEGTHAARPVTPNVPTGGTALYYETDTTNTFAWSGAAWVQINGGGGGATPAIVQNGAISGSSGIQSVTLGAAPTLGNMLIAFVDNASSQTAGTGWTILGVPNGVGLDFAFIAWKVAGAGESATQTPVNTAAAGAIVIYELTNAGPTIPIVSSLSGASNSYAVRSAHSGGLLLGAIANEQTIDLPTAITGAALDSSSGVGTRSIRGFHLTPSSGLNTIAYTYAVSHSVYGMGVVVY